MICVRMPLLQELCKFLPLCERAQDHEEVSLSACRACSFAFFRGSREIKFNRESDRANPVVFLAYASIPKSYFDGSSFSVVLTLL